MGHNKVFATGLAHDARIRLVGSDVTANLLPYLIEDAR